MVDSRVTIASSCPKPLSFVGQVFRFFGLLVSSSADISTHSTDVHFGGLDVHGAVGVASAVRSEQSFSRRTPVVPVRFVSKSFFRRAKLFPPSVCP